MTDTAKLPTFDELDAMQNRLDKLRDRRINADMIDDGARRRDELKNIDAKINRVKIDRNAAIVGLREQLIEKMKAAQLVDSGEHYTGFFYRLFRPIVLGIGGEKVSKIDEPAHLRMISDVLEVYCDMMRIRESVLPKISSKISADNAAQRDQFAVHAPITLEDVSAIGGRKSVADAMMTERNSDDVTELI